MPVRQVIHIDEDKCDGCGLCVPACQEGAIQIIDGKAKLVSDRYCDGLGDCLGHCPQGAITIVEREAEEFDEEAVEEYLRSREAASSPGSEEEPGSCPGAAPAPGGGGCPGARLMNLALGGENDERNEEEAQAEGSAPASPSALGQWPVQLALVPPQAPFWEGADLLVTADCVPFAYPDFHRELLSGHRVAVACPKLDDTAPYVRKLATIIAYNQLNSLTVAIMEVPCCSGLLQVVRQALQQSGQDLPLRVLQVSIEGEVSELQEARS